MCFSDTFIGIYVILYLEFEMNIILLIMLKMVIYDVRFVSTCEKQTPVIRFCDAKNRKYNIFLVLFRKFFYANNSVQIFKNAMYLVERICIDCT